MSIHRLAITSLIAVTALTAAATWEPLAAQSAQQDSAGTTAPVVFSWRIPSTPSIPLVNGASIDRGLVSVPARVSTPSDARQLVPTAPALRAPESSSASTSTAMMIVGGAGLIVGAVVGGKAGTVIMVGGGVVGLVGLWNYLK